MEKGCGKLTFSVGAINHWSHFLPINDCLYEERTGSVHILYIFHQHVCLWGNVGHFIML